MKSQKSQEFSLNTVWEKLVKTVLQDGEFTTSRNGATYELLGYQVRIQGTRFLTHLTRKLSPIYAAAELLWLMGDSADGEMICHYAPQYKKFLNDGKAWGHYGVRLHKHSQMRRVYEHLRDNPDSRRAVVTMWVPRWDLIAPSTRDIKDIPCTLSLQFLIRNNKLVTIVTMRSNDIWLGFPYDVFVFSGISELLAQRLGIPVGEYIHTAGSMHLYDKHLKNVQNFESGLDPHIEFAPTNLKVGYDSIQEFEKRGRTSCDYGAIAETFGPHSLITNCLILASLNFREKPLSDHEIMELSSVADYTLLSTANEVLSSRRRK